MKKLFFNLLILLSICLNVNAISTYSNIISNRTLDEIIPPVLSSLDEFVGPFNSWANIKRDYGAVGNGIVDDTAAFQRALNDLGNSGHSSVLYVSSGTYRITSTLVLTSKQRISIIGEHPDNTILKWDGTSGGTLLRLNGIAYSRVNRLTFDGNNGKCQVLLEQAIQTGNMQYFDTGNEYSDNVFKDSVYGLRGGKFGYGAAETSVLRCRFYRMSYAGISVANFNALDWWIWYCLFDDCNIGVTNLLQDGSGAGAYHVIRCLFHRSKDADMVIHNTMLFSIRHNTSVNSARFFRGAAIGSNGAAITLQDNTIIDSIQVDTINIGNTGPIMLIDNIIASRIGATGSVIVQYALNFAPDCVSIGNTYTINNPLNIQSGRILTLDDKVVSRSSLNLLEPVLPSVPVNMNRKIFEVASGNAAQIQDYINQSFNSWLGKRPIVHIPAADYSIVNTITIPANCDVQLVGDGENTALRWNGASSGSVLRLIGPSKVILRDFLVNCAKKVEGIIVDNSDQLNSRIYMMQTLTWRGVNANVLIDQLDNTLVEMHDVGFQSTAESGNGSALRVIGGINAAIGNSGQGRTSVFCAITSNDSIIFDVSNGGKLSIRDGWYEGGNQATTIKLNGLAFFTIEGFRLAGTTVGTQGNAANSIVDFNGKANILTCHPDNPITISGNGNGKVWIMSSEKHGSSSTLLQNNSSTIRAVMNNDRWLNTSAGSQPLSNQGVSDDAFIRDMLQQIRSEKPSNEPLSSLANGITDVRMYRVTVDSGTIGIHIKK